MIIREISKSLKPFSKIWSATIYRCYSSKDPHKNEIDDDDENEKNARKLKIWRNDPSAVERPAGLIGDNDFFSKKYPGCQPTNFQSWYQAKQREYLKWSQRYIPERHRTLGNQLAITHFVLHRGGKVKQKGVADFLCPDDLNELPHSFTPNWSIDEIDFSNSEICYEGLANFRDIKSLRKMSFKGCKYFDDWCLEKLMCMCPNIQYLDISDCRNITERGIEGLYRSWHLKNLIVTDFGYGAEFELTCLMLEDSMPGLKIEIMKISESNQQVRNSTDMSVDTDKKL